MTEARAFGIAPRQEYSLIQSQKELLPVHESKPGKGPTGEPTINRPEPKSLATPSLPVVSPPNHSHLPHGWAKVVASPPSRLRRRGVICRRNKNRSPVEKSAHSIVKRIAKDRLYYTRYHHRFRHQCGSFPLLHSGAKRFNVAILTASVLQFLTACPHAAVFVAILTSLSIRLRG